jgi:hypothetical protein
MSERVQLVPYISVSCVGRYCMARDADRRKPAEHVVGNGGENIKVGHRVFCTGGFCRVQNVTIDKTTGMKRAQFVDERDYRKPSDES